jgi:hypothetical protein
MESRETKENPEHEESVATQIHRQEDMEVQQAQRSRTLKQNTRLENMEHSLISDNDTPTEQHACIKQFAACADKYLDKSIRQSTIPFMTSCPALFLISI